ncbi:N-acetyltransferase [Actinoplanes lobatus]|uniref:N-acetyltransferase n=1 Tax=Actinoplanes lobatus TaxID=113568 RepID=A0A7W7HGM5_9ACTN|nr:GNAT family N-acetyltransferase [Actinoplanes lobatus]MBB4749722.1 ribosomal protein S18 acetylase RimI-like enzyme [Actinoplanes lobatus]GGN75940.1 N-acetyltransferase [Actinoplanes lobatus]GIE38460.1 N-acetyltransferase [Actinoplanes lobatus]
MTEEISIARAADRERVVASLVAAFAEDPVLRFICPDPEDYPAQAAVFFGHLFDKRVGRGTIWTIGGGASVAIWEPPSGGDVPAAEMDLPADALARVKEYDEAVHLALPGEPFWYLGVLGTHPASAGRGWGRAVMAAGLRRAAEDGLPAVLETSKPANVDLYRRAGWRVLSEFSSPFPTWIMTR